MEGRAGSGLLTGLLTGLLLLAALNSAVAQDKPSFFTIGGDLVLRPLSVPEGITRILWKHKGALVSEWVEDKVPLLYYGSFRGRTTLDITSGRLEIKNMTSADEGLFKVEINSKIRSEGYEAQVMKELSQPVVWIRPVACNPASDSCTLSCEGDTKGAEPVTYSWKMGEEEWKESTKDVTITKTEMGHVKKFTCRMKNPVSEYKVSEPRDNPLFEENSQDNPRMWTEVMTLAFRMLAVCTLGIIVGLVFHFRRTIRKRICCRDQNGADNAV